MAWSCMCNDRCPECDCEIEPYKSDDLDAAAEEARSINYYRCPTDGTRWSMAWSCMRNDRCPECDCEIEPYRSDDLDGAEDAASARGAGPP